MPVERAPKKARLREASATLATAATTTTITTTEGISPGVREALRTTITPQGLGTIMTLPQPAALRGHRQHQIHEELMYHKDPMVFFSEEIALHILELLTPAELAQCACVARQWYRLVNDQMLWRRLFYKDQFVYPRGLRNAGRIPKSTPSGSTTSQDRRLLKRKRSGLNNDHPQQQQQQQRHHRQEEHMVYGDPSANMNPCWKALYRLNHNWVAGQAQVSSLSIQQLSYQDQLFLETAGGSSDQDAGTGRVGGGSSRLHSPIVQFQGPVLLVVSPGDMVHLWRIKLATEDKRSLPPSTPILPNASSRKPEFWQTYRCSRKRTGGQGGAIVPSAITCLALDRSAAVGDAVGWQKVMVGYSSGHFSIFEYILCQEQSGTSNNKQESTTLREIGSTMDLPAWSDVGGIQSASFLYPILTTCSDDGTISIYKIQEDHPESSDPSEPRHWSRLLHRLYGSSPLSPVEMELRPIVAQHQASSLTTSFEQDQQHNDGNTTRPWWRALITFGLQLMDGSWTVRLQVIEFDEQFIRHSTETGVDDDSALEEANGAQQEDGDGDKDEETYLRSRIPSSAEPLSSRLESAGHARIGTISAITISSPYVVTTHPDNTMNVFHMARPFTTGKNNSKGRTGGAVYLKPIRFRHLSTLYGHCGAVSSVAIESRSGRLVSASMDRSIKVWTMVGRNRYDQLEQRRVHQCALSMNDLNQSWTLGAQVNREEGLGLVWVGTDDEKIVSMNSDGTVKVWLFS